MEIKTGLQIVPLLVVAPPKVVGSKMLISGWLETMGDHRQQVFVSSIAGDLRDDEVWMGY